MVSTFPSNTSDANLFFHVNRTSRLKPQTRDYGVPKRFGEPSPYTSYAAPVHPLPREQRGDKSAHYRMLRKGLLPKVPTFRRRIFTDFDPQTRIEESIPRTREERQSDKLVSGVSAIAEALGNFLGKANVPYKTQVQASQTAMRTLLEKYNVSMGGRINALVNQMTPEQVTHIFDDLESKFERGEIDAAEAERIITKTIEGESKHEHKHEEKEEGEVKGDDATEAAERKGYVYEYTTQDRAGEDRDVYRGPQGGRYYYRPRDGAWIHTVRRSQDLPDVPERERIIREQIRRSAERALP